MAVFIDYQNVYKGARAAFCPYSTNHVDGQISPLTLGRHLTKGRRLVSVRIYRGMPSQTEDEKGYAAALRQTSLWDQHALVNPCTRPLNYRDRAAPKEKGIDVLLAIDFVMMAMRGEYDVGILFSADTDLVPALEAVTAMKGEQACEVAYWMPPTFTETRQARPLGVPGMTIKKIGLRETDYLAVHDATDYTRRRRRR